MKLHTLLHHLYAAGHWFELDTEGRTVICKPQPLTPAQARGLVEHGPAITRRMCHAAAVADAAIAAARATPARADPVAEFQRTYGAKHD